MKYIHSCKTCKNKKFCLDTNEKILTCNKYKEDGKYNHKEENKN